jgi:condensin complex subunit 2
VEAIERSRASQADLGRSLMMADDPDDDSFLSGDDGGGGGFAPDDFGGADDDDDDIMGGGDAFPVSFIHDGDHRFSSESFQTTFAAARPPSQATVLLDAIAAGHISGSQSNYEYFNKKALETMILQGNGNQWAGAAHWKKMQPKRKPNKKAGATTDDSQESTSTTTTKTTKKKKGGRTNKTKRGGGIVVDISKPALADIKDILKKAPKGKKGSSNPLQMTKAAISKASKNENLLPLDAGIKVENFTSLFLRPNTNVHDISAAAQSSASMPTRQVGFGGVETWGQNDSFGGDDDDGPGFNFGGDFDDDNGPAGDYVVPELEGVRKVEKVRVGYATIAKKVDVRRLKMDLWDELDRTFQERGPTPAWEPKQKTVEGDEEDIDDDATVDEDDDKMNDNDDGKAKDQQQRQDLLSFQDTVREMQTSQSQSDVSLPFYFICILHLANEKGLALESCGLEDFIIHSS